MSSYDDAIYELIKLGEKVKPKTDDEGLFPVIEKICKEIGIARLDMSYPRLICFYEEESYNKAAEYAVEKGLEDGTEIGYVAYPKEGQQFSDDQLRLVDTLISTLFLINCKSNAERVAFRFAYFDQVFDVYNLNYVLRTLGVLISRGQITDYCFCRFNFKGFDHINEKLGHQLGDVVIQKYINLLGQIAGPGNVIGRVGGDNWAMIFPKGHMEAVRKFLNAAEIDPDMESVEPVIIKSRCGCYIIDNEKTSADEIMRNATVVEHMTRNPGAGNFILFDGRVKEILKNKAGVEEQFVSAIENEEFKVFYQPKYDVKNEVTLCGAEALCRWIHGNEVLSPARFIPILEQSNAICTLDFYMLDHVCANMRKWLDDGIDVVPISINMSRMHLGDEDFCEQIVRIVDVHNIPHELIELELTETTVDVNFTELSNLVRLLKQAGFRTAVDDFGVGYSSMNMISNLKWDVLKLDRSLLPHDANEVTNKIKLLKHVVAMAKDLGLECVAEGVEVEEQLQIMKELGCYKIQGFYFDKPMPLEEFETRLQ